MIDIPERVQDALRDGRYLKNYKFKIVEENEQEDFAVRERWDGGQFVFNEWVQPVVGTYTITSDYRYQFRYQGASMPSSRYVIGQKVGNVYTAEFTLTVEEQVNVWIEWLEPHSVWADCEADITKIFKPIETIIENDHLVKESVSFDERMCSDETIKFGLCEGTTLEFQYFGFPNLVGKRIQAFIDIQYKDENKQLQWYRNLPMGWFDVDECSMQFATKIRKCKAYNKLKAKFLDEKANDMITEAFGYMGYVYLIDILNYLLSGYGIREVEQGGLPIGRQNTVISAQPKKYFTPYRYKYNKRDYGPFSSLIARVAGAGDATGTDFYMQGNADMYWYFPVNEHYDDPIQIRFDVDLDEIDRCIVTHIKKNLEMMELYGDVDPLLLWNRIVKMKTDEKWYTQYPLLPCYFFFIEVHYHEIPNDPNSEVVKRFGYTAKQECSEWAQVDGTFADLSRLTFKNVLRVRVVLPKNIQFGAQFVSNNTYLKEIAAKREGGTITMAPEGMVVDPHEWATNKLWLLGENYHYIYDDDEGYHQVSYDGAEYENRKLIPEDISGFIHVNAIENYSDAEMIRINLEELPDVTLRELQTAAFETQCQFGKLDRETDLFSGVELNQERLFPAEDLYPREDLYPAGGQEGSFRSQYSKLWFDEGGIETWKYLIITYKGLEEDEQGNLQEKDFTLQRTINPDGTTNYNMSDNWLFRNLIWTAEQVGEYADKMVAKMRGITWFPFEMWAAGLPYIETGDEIEINAYEETHVSYVLQRQLRGIQNLQDTFINGQLDIF